MMNAAALVLGLLLVHQARADLPVHCLKHQVVGEWEFTLSAASAERQHCGHRTPDREEAQPKLVVEGKNSSRKMNLLASMDATEGQKKGKWTMIYDEGIDVEMDGYNFLAFSRFDLNVTTKHNVSHCGETQLGWYSKTDKSAFGCFHAKKVDADKHKSFLQSSLPAPRSGKQDSQYYEVTRDLEWHKEKARQLNLRQDKSWTARAYPRWAGKTLREVNALMGIRRPFSRAEARKNAPKSSFMQVRRQQTKKYPTTWDWRNGTDGLNFLEPVMDQGACGSCYVVSMTRVLTARHKVATKNPDAVPFSITYPLMCAEYNQGCNGGYGFLVGKWSEDVGLIPANCARYDINAKCPGQSLPKDCMKPGEKRWRADKPRYVGGFYGGTTVESMKQELYEKGPISAGIEPADDFMFYDSGIYESAGAPNLVHHNPAVGEWERVDHAIVLHGWGEEKGKKYWTLQNSWGPDWGEEGFFRIVMGPNDSGIESIAEAVDVVEDERHGKNVVSFQAFA